LGGGDHADARGLEQAGASGGDKFFELGFVFGGFGLEHECAAGHGSDGAHRGAVFDAVAGQVGGRSGRRSARATTRTRPTHLRLSSTGAAAIGVPG
jgi:hypothetical protein